MVRVQNAVLFDGTGADPVPDAELVVGDDGAILFAGPASSAPPQEEGEDILDAHGGWVLPGFIDVHVHLAWPFQNFSLAARLEQDPAYRTLLPITSLHDTLMAGVTSARDLGGMVSGYRRAIEERIIDGPRMSLSVSSLSHTGGHGDMSALGGDYQLRDDFADPVLVDTPDEARIAVRRNIRAGADCIKVYATGGMGSPFDDPDDDGLSEEEIRAVVDEASRHGEHPLPVAAHAQGTRGILNALRGGVTSIEHGYGIDDEGIDIALERGVWIVPTQSTNLGLDKDAMPPYHYAKKMKWAAKSKKNLTHAIARGVKVAMGTDAAVGPHGVNLRELAMLVELGMTPAEAIVAGTRSGAELLGWGDRLGTLERGKLGDFVIVDVDPLADIAAIGEPSHVVLVAQGGIIRKNLLAGANSGE